MGVEAAVAGSHRSTLACCRDSRPLSAPQLPAATGRRCHHGAPSSSAAGPGGSAPGWPQEAQHSSAKADAAGARQCGPVDIPLAPGASAGDFLAEQQAFGRHCLLRRPSAGEEAAVAAVRGDVAGDDAEMPGRNAWAAYRARGRFRCGTACVRVPLRARLGALNRYRRPRSRFRCSTARTARHQRVLPCPPLPVASALPPPLARERPALRPPFATSQA